MNGFLFIASLSFGCIAGVIGGIHAFSFRERRARSKQIKTRVGCVSYLSAKNIHIESRGLHLFVIQKMVMFSESRANEKKRTFLLPWAFALEKNETVILKAGLQGFVNKDGIYQSRLLFSLFGLAMGLFLGGLLSSVLAVIFSILLFLFGFIVPIRALKAESVLRSRCIERQLSQMIEVVILGLRSGLSFDRSAKLYTQYFEGSLKESFSRAQSQWEHGLSERNTALRQLADTFDSSLFSRAVESIVRSLRFGSSLSESLSLIASEARSVRKTALEEQIAKAPIKMLLPVGTLILPAMLILIMGPILLDLVNGI